MIAAGQMDRRIVVERFDESLRNALNEPQGAWVTVCQLWAERRDQSDAESVAAAANGSALVARFSVRSTSETRAITPAMRINDGAMLWNIKGLMNGEARRRGMVVILAVADSAGGNP